MIKAFHNTTVKTSERIEANGFLYAAAELRRRGVPLAMRPSDEFPPDGNEFVYLYPECHQYSNDRLTFRGEIEPIGEGILTAPTNLLKILKMVERSIIITNLKAEDAVKMLSPEERARLKEILS